MFDGNLLRSSKNFYQPLKLVRKEPTLVGVRDSVVDTACEVKSVGTGRVFFDVSSEVPELDRRGGLVAPYRISGLGVSDSRGAESGNVQAPSIPFTVTALKPS